MPRKKQSGLSISGIPGGSSIASAIAKALKDEPPSIYAMAAETQHQKTAWISYKQYFSSIGALIDSYSTGTPPPDFSYREDEDELFGAARGYLMFYGMVWANWPAVKSVLDSASIPPIPITTGNGIVVTAPIRDFTTLSLPLDVAIESVRYDAIAVMTDFFVPHKKFDTPYKIREAIKLEEKARKPKATPVLKKKHQDSVQRLLIENPCSLLKMICTQAVIDSNPKGARKDWLVDYQRELAKSEVRVKAALHRRKVAHTPRYAARNGVLMELCS